MRRRNKLFWPLGAKFWKKGPFGDVLIYINVELQIKNVEEWIRTPDSGVGFLVLLGTPTENHFLSVGLIILLSEWHCRNPENYPTYLKTKDTFLIPNFSETALEISEFYDRYPLSLNFE
jgi:hypothetical protein